MEKGGSGGGEDQNSVGDSVVIFSIRPLKYLTSCLLTTGKCTATQGGVGRVVQRIGWTAWICRMAGVVLFGVLGGLESPWGWEWGRAWSRSGVWVSWDIGAFSVFSGALYGRRGSLSNVFKIHCPARSIVSFMMPCLIFIHPQQVLNPPSYHL